MPAMPFVFYDRASDQVTIELFAIAFTKLEFITYFFDTEPLRNYGYFVYPKLGGPGAILVSARRFKSGFRLALYRADDNTAGLIIPYFRYELLRCSDLGEGAPSADCGELARLAVHPFSAPPPLAVKYRCWVPSERLSKRFDHALWKLASHPGTTLPAITVTFGHVQLRAVRGGGRS